MIVTVAAMGRDRVIGQDGHLPWKMPADMRHFREVTRGKTVIMGRKTYESIGRPLPDRTNLVLSRARDFTIPGCQVVSFEEALEHPELYVLGGEEIYRLFLPRAQRQILTEIHGDFMGDTYYPDFSRHEWKEVERIDHPADAENPHPYSFVTWERV